MNIIILEKPESTAPVLKLEKEVIYETALKDSGLPWYYLDNFLYLDALEEHRKIADSNINSVLISSISKICIPVVGKTKSSVKIPVTRNIAYFEDNELLNTASGDLDIYGISTTYQPYDESVGKLYHFGPFCRDFYPNTETPETEKRIEFLFNSIDNVKNVLYDVSNYINQKNYINDISYPLMHKFMPVLPNIRNLGLPIFALQKPVTITPNMSLIFDALQESSEYRSYEEIYQLFAYRSVMDLYFMLDKYGYEYIGDKLEYIKMLNKNKILQKIQRNNFLNTELDFVTKNQAALRMFGIGYKLLPESKRKLLTFEKEYIKNPVFLKLEKSLNFNPKPAYDEVVKKYPELKKYQSEGKTGIYQVGDSQICSHILFQATEDYNDLLDIYGIDTKIGKCCRYCGQVIGLIDQGSNIEDSGVQVMDENVQMVWVEVKKIFRAYVEFPKNFYIKTLINNIVSVIYPEIETYHNRLLKSQTIEKNYFNNSMVIFTTCYILASAVFYINNNPTIMKFKNTEKVGGSDNLKNLAYLVNTGFSILMRYTYNYVKDSVFDEQTIKKTFSEAIKYVNSGKKVVTETKSNDYEYLLNDTFYQYIYQMKSVISVIQGKKIPEITDFELLIGKDIKTPGYVYSDLEPFSDKKDHEMVYYYIKNEMQTEPFNTLRTNEFYKKFDTSENWKEYWNSGKLSRFAGLLRNVPVVLPTYRVKPGYFMCSDRKKHLFNIVKIKGSEIPKKSFDDAFKKLDLGFFKQYKNEKVTDQKCSKCGILFSDAENTVIKPEDKKNIFFEMFAVTCPESLTHVYNKDKCIKCEFQPSFLNNRSSEDALKYFKKYENKMNRKTRLEDPKPVKFLETKLEVPKSIKTNEVSRLSELIKVDRNIIVNIGTNIGQRFEQIERNEINRINTITPEQQKTQIMFLNNYIQQLIQYSYIIINKEKIYHLPDLVKSVFSKFQIGEFKIKKADFDDRIKEFSLLNIDSDSDINVIGPYLVEFMAGYLLQLSDALEKEVKNLGVSFAKAFLKYILEKEKNLSKPIISLIKKNEKFDNTDLASESSHDSDEIRESAEGSENTEETTDIFQNDMDLGDEEENLEANLD